MKILTRYGLFVASLTAMVTLTACKAGSSQSITDEQRDQVENELKQLHTADSLQWQADRYAADGNQLGQIVALRLLGKLYREENRFDQAIINHRRAYGLAEILDDTLEMINILNNLGTNYRRLGSLTEASGYHLQALGLSMQLADQTSNRACKNRVVSLNGLGNVYLSMNNYEQADSVLRLALAGERQLDSQLGQAINLANLGSIKEHLGQIDSAWYYYNASMDMNNQCHSQLGISLCHTHFGELYEREGNYVRALQEYTSAFEMMVHSPDDWHRLEAQLSIARIYIKVGQPAKAMAQLQEASATAVRIGSLEHRAEICHLFYQLYELTGDTRRALDNHVRYAELSDSVLNMKKVNEIQNKIVALERDRRQHELTLAQENLQLERQTRRVGTIAFVALMLLAVAAIAFLWYHLRTRTKTQRIMQQVQQSREMFFTNVTHEFRTPLTVILGLGHQLEDMMVEDMSQVRSAAKMIVRQGNSLLNLINQLLDISKVRSAVGEPKWRHGNIVAYVNMVIENFQPYAQGKRQELTYSHSLSQIDMDFVPDYVNKIVSNLLSNAIKYTPQYGKINLTLEQMQGQHLKIQVFDTGRGIAPQTLSRVFEAFVQGEQQVGDVGTGVGLSLVKMMTEAMGGEVEAESTEGQGSTFSVILPMRHAEGIEQLELTFANELTAPQVGSMDQDQDTTPQDASPSDNKEKQSTILIVEDNQDIAYYIGMHLQHHRLLYARGGAEGLQKAEEMMPDLIITDVMMPGDIDGLELCRRIRAAELTSHIPIIIITAKTTEQDRVRGLEAGADAYLVKPFNSEELLVRVNKLIQQRLLMRQKFGYQLIDDDKKELQLTAQDRQFMNRLIDAVHSLMPQGKTDVESVADRMALSRSQLNRKMIAITGQNSQTYIMRLRLSYAKRLLKSDVTMPIGDVAQRCGFEDVAYFSRIFKQQFDMTPSQYRKSE